MLLMSYMQRWPGGQMDAQSRILKLTKPFDLGFELAVFTFKKKITKATYKPHSLLLKMTFKDF